MRGIKRGAQTVIKGAKRHVFNPEFGRGFQSGLRKVGRGLQYPAKWVRKHDPLAKKMGDWGFLSPISLGAEIALAPMSGIGYFQEMAGDPKLQEKLRSGDPDTIMDTTFAGVSLVPMGYAAQGAKKGFKAGAKVIRAGKKAGRKAGKKIIKAVGGLF